MINQFRIFMTGIIIFSGINYAQPYPELKLLGHYPLSGFVCDVTGYYDSASGKEYAIVGNMSYNTWIIDVTNPALPMQVSQINVPGFDLKIWRNYLYCVTGSGGENRARIVDITLPENPGIVDSFYSAHNIFISEKGLLFAESPGLKVYNLNDDPLNPELIFDSFDNDGHDATVIDNYVYDFHGNSGTNIYHINNKPDFSLELLSNIHLPLISYHHSGWITEDKSYLFICDEGATGSEPDITVWDIRDPANPEYVTQFVDTTAIVHNLYIKGNYAYTSYYNSGLRIFDISDPANLKVAAHYDTNPTTGDDFHGAFGCYPFTKSGNIYISDQTGLYIFSFAEPVSIEQEEQLPGKFNLSQNYPNPFNPTTTIKYTIPDLKTSLSHTVTGSVAVTLKVYDILGNEAAILVNETKQPGIYEVKFNAEGLPSGIYFYTLVAGSMQLTNKMMLLK